MLKESRGNSSESLENTHELRMIVVHRSFKLSIFSHRNSSNDGFPICEVNALSVKLYD